MRTIAVVNQKGGCGKTTTAINLAALYAKRGLRTLLVDMDPQAHCAAGLGVPESSIEFSIGHALLAEHSPRFNPSQLCWEVSRNLHLAPSTVMLAALEAPGGGLHQLPDKDRRLESLLNLLRDRYDRCLIDCPPTIGLLTFNALRAAREALIPVETGFFSLRGSEKQWNTIQRIIQHIGRPIACHLLATLHNPDSKLACNILAALRRQFAGQILPTVIHEHEVLREATSFGQPVWEYAPGSDAARDFEALADWLEEHAANPVMEIEILGQQPIQAATEPVQSAPFAGLTPPEAESVARTFESSTPPLPRPSSAASPRPALGSRAAELARRVHEITARSAGQSPPIPFPIANAAAPLAPSTSAASQWPSTQPHGGAPHSIAGSHTPPPTQQEQGNSQPPPLQANESAPPLRMAQFHPADFPIEAPLPAPTHLFGARLTNNGVLFVQPINGARAISVAGDFNRWSPLAHPLRLNSHAQVFETVIDLPPGKYQYRLVIDGKWTADPHNSNQQRNAYGEPNSVVVVL